MGWSKKQQDAYDLMVAEAKEKYNAAQGSWIDFVLYLWSVEDKGTWRLPNYNGFGDFLKKEFPAAWGLARYTNAKRAVQVYGENFMRRMGIECSHAITIDAVITNDMYVEKVKQTCEDHFLAHGVMPDVNTVRDYVDRIARPSRPASRLSEQRRRERDLQQEVSQLRQLRNKAERVVAKHEALADENAALKSKLKEKRSESTETKESLLAENRQLKSELREARARIRELEKALARAEKELERERSGKVKKNGTTRTSKETGTSVTV